MAPEGSLELRIEPRASDVLKKVFATDLSAGRAANGEIRRNRYVSPCLILRAVRAIKEGALGVGSAAWQSHLITRRSCT